MNMQMDFDLAAQHWDHDFSSDDDDFILDDSDISSTSDELREFKRNMQDEKSMKELQKLLDSSKPSDKEILNAKIEDIIKQDSTALFMSLIENNYKLEILNDKGQTALHLAWYYRANVLSLILDFPNYITENSTDCNGLNYLHIACYAAHEKLAHIFLKEGVNVNAQFESDPKGLRNKFTPLHFAASIMVCESREVIKLLLKFGANINAEDYLGRTPLHIACGIYEEFFIFSESLNACSSMKLVKTLLENGSDPNARDKYGNTPLLSIISDYYNAFGIEEEEEEDDFAISLPYKEIQQKLKYFLKKSAIVDFLAINNDGNNILHRIIENLKFSRYLNNVPVDFSYDVEYAKMIERILTSNTGINVNARNYFGDTPLQLAVSLMSFDIVQVLLEHNADVNCLSFSQDDQYCFCCPTNHPTLDMIQKVISIIKLLLIKGWKLTCKDNLILMKFLVHDVDYCECQFNRPSVINDLMDYSSAEHFLRIINKSMEDLCIYGQNCIYRDIYRALHYKKLFNLYVDKEILDAASARKQMPVMSYIYEESQSNYKDNDIVRMKYIKLKGNMSLYDVMTRHPHKIYRYVKNEDFNEITKLFTYFGNTVKGHVAKSLVRHHIEKMATEYLRILFHSPIPNLCCRQILSYFSNADIVNLCSAAIFEEE